MNMNVFLGMSAFDQQTHDVCEILESTAPNVSELQLFRDEAAGVCMDCEYLFIFPLFFVQICILFLSPCCLPSRPVIDSLFAPGPLGWRCRLLAVLAVAISDLN